MENLDSVLFTLDRNTIYVNDGSYLSESGDSEILFNCFISNAGEKTQLKNDNKLSIEEIVKRKLYVDDDDEDDEDDDDDDTVSSIVLLIPYGNSDQDFLDSADAEISLCIDDEEIAYSSKFEDGRYVKFVIAPKETIVKRRFETIALKLTVKNALAKTGITAFTIMLGNINGIKKASKKFYLHKTVTPLFVKTFAPEYTNYQMGDDVTLTWKTAGMDFAIINPGNIHISKMDTSCIVKPTEETVYTIEAHGKSEGEKDCIIKKKCLVSFQPPQILKFDLNTDSGIVSWNVINSAKVLLNGKMKEQSGSLLRDKQISKWLLEAYGNNFYISQTFIDSILAFPDCTIGKIKVETAGYLDDKVGILNRSKEAVSYPNLYFHVTWVKPEVNSEINLITDIIASPEKTRRVQRYFGPEDDSEFEYFGHDIAAIYIQYINASSRELSLPYKIWSNSNFYGQK